MTEPTGTRVQIRPGLLDRLKLNSGIRSDDSFARTIGISRPTLARIKAGEEPTLRTVVGIMQAFGLGFGEVTVVESATSQTAAEPIEAEAFAS